MFIAVVITAIGCVPLIFIPVSMNWLVYIFCPITQVGMAIMINISTSLISDVIGKDAESSAFVYGFYSFMDKIANGFAIERSLKLFEESALGLSIIMAFLPILCALIAFILTFVGKKLYSDKLARLSIRPGSRPMVGGH